MKALTLILIGALFFIPSLNAGETHEHAKAGGPKGGRLLENTNPSAEFFVEKDKTAVITFYDTEMKPIPAENQKVTLIAEKDGIKTPLEFENKEDVLKSKGQLPEGANLVVQFRQTPEAKPMNFRFALNEEICSECQRAEYACICGH